MEMRDILLYLTLKHQGNWEKIYNDIASKTFYNDKDINETVENFKGNFITIVDKEYPTKLKNTWKPPFVLFYEGDINLIKKDNIISVSCTRTPNDKDFENAKGLLENDQDLTYLIGSLKNPMDKYVLSLKQPKIAILGHSFMEKSVLENYDNCDLVLTECPPNKFMDNNTMVQRTRIIAGLLDKELVISGENLSSTEIIVNEALTLGKDILVVPNKAKLNIVLLDEGAIPCVRPQQLA